MPDAYQISDGKFLIQTSLTSAADAISVSGPIVPANKVWTILQAAYYPSVAETRTVYMAIYTAAGYTFPITLLQSLALSASAVYPGLREGMEIKLFPGDRLIAFRDVATAGSSMVIRTRYIENDLPLFTYIEPQETLRIKRRALSSVASTVARAGGTVPSAGVGTTFPGPGRGSPRVA